MQQEGWRRVCSESQLHLLGKRKTLGQAQVSLPSLGPCPPENPEEDQENGEWHAVRLIMKHVFLKKILSFSVWIKVHWVKVQDYLIDIVLQ